MTSAYPIAVDELADRVRQRATELRAWPSRNRVKSEFRVGGPKAAAALAVLREAGFDPTRPDQTSTGMADTGADSDRPTGLAASLHAVPDLPEDSDTATSRDAPAIPAGPTTEPAGSGPDREVPAADSGDDAAPASGLVIDEAGPGPRAVRVPRWPLLLIAAGAFVSIWGGWVGLGELTGFGPIRLLPGIADSVVLNSAITLPIGVEAYAAFAMWAWLAPRGAAVSDTARRFARRSAIGALVLGAGGQITYHLLTAAGLAVAPWPVTAFVACLPVIVLGCGAALTHLIGREQR